MGRPNAWGTLGCVAAVGLGLTASALSAEGASYTDGMLRKLGRGIANVATCPGELLRTPTLLGHREGYLSAMTVGVVQGLWRTVLRGGVGVFEIATFYAEIPKDFKPMMMPEFIHADGAWVE